VIALAYLVRVERKGFDVIEDSPQAQYKKRQNKFTNRLKEKTQTAKKTVASRRRALIVIECEQKMPLFASRGVYICKLLHLGFAAALHAP
jgi:hypothetical protein